MYIRNYHRRFTVVFLFFIIIFVACIARLLFIQLFRSNFLGDLAKKQHSLYIELEPRRGTIYDTNQHPLAFNITCDSLFAAPNEIQDKDKNQVIRTLSSMLHTDESVVRDRIGRKKSFIWIYRKLPQDLSIKIKQQNLKGVGFVKESKRSYPNGYLLSHVIGFAGLDNNGLDGLELYYDKYLKGQPGWALFLRDARQKKLDIWERMVLPKDGCDIVLTIDDVVQYIAERELDKAYKSSRAESASIIVMNPHTGEILALANRPTYDLNDYQKTSKDSMRNRAITDMFEPGSVFKIVTAAAAIEENKVAETQKFYCENGSYKYSTHTLHDHRPHGWLTFREVIEQSSNIGTCKIAQIVGADTLYKYIKLFGFGTKTGIELQGEVAGVAREPRFWSKISITAVPMGQEICVTALQLTSAISVIANGGQLMKPFIIREIRNRETGEVRNYSPSLERKVISLDTAARVRKMLIGVVENGTGKLAKIEGISVAGKTGTAQKLEPNGTYSHSKYVASFIGFTPAENPQLAICVIIDSPRSYYYGGVIAAPVFKNVAVDVLRYFKTREPVMASQIE